MRGDRRRRVRAGRAAGLILLLFVASILTVPPAATSGAFGVARVSAPLRVLTGSPAIPPSSPRAASSLAYGPPGGCGVEECTGPSSPPPGSSVWTNLSSSPSPAPERDGALTYDVATQSVLWFGGYGWTGSFTNDTWEFANGSWRNITSTAGSAPAPSSLVMTYDAVEGYVLAYSDGATWSFSDGQWHAIAANDTPSGHLVVGAQSLVYDSESSYAVLTTGLASWTYANGSWAAVSGAEPGSVGAAAYDAAAGCVVFFASNITYGEFVGNSTWEFAGGAWTNVSSAVGAAPTPRTGFAMAYDTATQSVLLFGGGRNASTGGGQFIELNDTWSLFGGTWTNVTSSLAPQGAEGLWVAADDPADSGVVMFGGSSNPSPEPLNETWIWSSVPPIANLSVDVSPEVPSPGAVTSFDPIFEGGVPPYTYQWLFGDGGSSGAVDPTHTFALGGFYVVRVWVNDSAAHSAEGSRDVHVYLPLALRLISVSPNPTPLGGAVNFSANATGGTPPYSYSWVFGDGGTGGNLSSIAHIFTTEGPFVTTVTVSDDLGAVARANVTISVELEALAGTSASSGSAPLTVSFVGQAQGGTPPYRYEWSFGDGASSIAQDPRHTYNETGQYTVVLTVLDRDANRSTSTLVIEVGGASPFIGWEVLGAGAGAALVLAAVWGTLAVRQQRRRREGERWIAEITSTRGPESEERKS
jgi:PKD repeat protein